MNARQRWARHVAKPRERMMRTRALSPLLARQKAASRQRCLPI
jgi:hypothetical protein